MPNFSRMIKSHNNRLLKPNNNTTSDRPCNCRDPENCPLDGNCLIRSTIYQATVTDANTGETETYVGSTATDFKARFYNHRHSFNTPDLQYATKLSSHVWNLKNKDHRYSIAWKILKQIPPYKSGSSACNLCLSEKYIITFKPNLCSLNSRSELMNFCRHQGKFLLKNYKNT